MRALKFLLIFLFISGYAISQERNVLRLNLQQAQQYALEHNKSLKNVRTDVAISKQKFRQAIAQGLPQISGSMDYTNFFNYEIEFSFGGGNNTPNIDFTKLDEGDFQILSFLQQTMGSGPTTIKMKNSSTAKVQATQLIFSGQYITGIQLAKIGQMLADMNVVKSEIDVRESVISMYYLGLLTNKSIELIEANIQNLRQTQVKTEALFKAGMIEDTDLEQLQMSILVLETTKNNLLRNSELNKNILKFQLGIDEDIDIELTEDFDNIINNIDISTLLVEQFDASQNITMQMLEKQEELTRKMVDLERWSFAPTIAAVYNRNIKIVKTDFDMTPVNLVAFSMSVPIFSSGLRQSKLEQRKLEYYQFQNNKDIFKDQLQMQEKQLRYNLKSALEQFENQKKNLELAQRVYDKTEFKFSQGVVTGFQLTQANSSLLQAQSSYISAAMELLQAKLKFDKLLNKI
ncbi:MAG TPA: TolC family protein [Bacteroidales bacterium]|nr:TolC family protein [Bacteroidales bacterium]HOL98705.1 TolC family protein [Bacteroidales bacterium]HUM33125.1 TolC family protein [Bacteroidales bacterium]